jgi:hypothetical protein
MDEPESIGGKDLDQILTVRFCRPSIVYTFYFKNVHRPKRDGTFPKIILRYFNQEDGPTPTTFISRVIYFLKQLKMTSSIDY